MKTRRGGDETSSAAASVSANIPFRNLFAETNRGLLFDLIIFIANLFFMQYLAGLFVGLFREAAAGDEAAKLMLGLTAVGMWVLPAAGAVLKRWHLHERLGPEVSKHGFFFSKLSGCLFNPIFYFCLNLVITSAILTVIGEFAGKRVTQNGAVFTTLIVLGVFLTIVQTTLIYLYFSRPKKPPRFRFLMDPRSELLGDAFLFINLLLFQIAWNLITYAPFGPPTSFIDFAGRLFFLSFMAMLIYFPPRMFYLAEDIHRPRAWLTMLLANSPVILRILFGPGSNAMIGG